MVCECQLGSTPQDSGETASGGSGETYGTGTVLDGFIATKGTVVSVADAGNRITILSEDPDYPGLKVELEAGFPGLFDGIGVRWGIYASFAVSHVLESTGDRPTTIAATAYTCFIVHRASGNDSDYNDIFSKYDPSDKDDSIEILQGMRAARVLADSIKVLAEDLEYGPSPICFYAILKASATDEVVGKLRELAAQLYFPYETDCVPAAGAGNRGVVNVVYRLRHFVSHTEKALIFPVRLRTWDSVDRTSMHHRVASFFREPIEVSPKRYCAWSCRKCRYAVEAARVACVAACSAATSGIGTAVCIAACNVAADERKANC